MCIRDRIERGSHARERRTDATDDDAEDAADPDLLRRCDVCLLYTSDAADERSSVDLGGRRIIKKKKNRNNEERIRYQ